MRLPIQISAIHKFNDETLEDRILIYALCDDFSIWEFVDWYDEEGECIGRVWRRLPEIPDGDINIGPTQMMPGDEPIKHT